MDFLNKFVEQLRDLFASMTPGARITTGALLAVVVVSVAFLFKQSSAGPDAALFGGTPLTGPEIIAIEGALGQQRLSDYKIVGQMIMVPNGKKAEYVAAIADGGAMPKSVGSHMDDAFDKMGVFDGNEQKKARFKAAEERKLSQIVSSMYWVDNANVSYDIKQNRGRRRTVLASASVSVMPKPNEALDSTRKRNIQQLVAHNFAGMKSEQVFVMSLGGEVISDSTRISPDDFGTPYLQEQAKLEERVRQKVLELVGPIDGVLVQVMVELNEVLSSVERTSRPTDPPQVISEKSVTNTTSQSNTDGGGAPGAIAQGPTRGRNSDPVAKRTNNANSSVQEAESYSRIFDTKSEIVKAPLVPKEIRASIQVPYDYVVGVWRKEKLDETGTAPDLVVPEEIRLVEQDIKLRIQTAVEPLMPELEAGKDDFSQVKVVTYRRLPVTPIPPPSVTDKALFWATENGGSLALVGLAGFSLVMLRSMVRSSGKDDPSGSPALQLDNPTESHARSEAEDDPERPKLRLKKADTVKGDLADMVREDPDAAAAILSNWISNAS